jgi:hypothetical protein
MTYDLQILRGQAPSTTVSLTPAHVVTGTPKLVTRFCHLFLRDTDASRARGTDFSALLRTGRIRTSADVVLRFTASAVDVLEQLGDQRALPDAERLVRAELVAHEFTDVKLLLTVRLVTRNGVTEFPLPLDRAP